MSGATSAEGTEFRAAAQFNPMYSVTGRMIRLLAADDRQAGAYFLVVLPTLIMGMVIMQSALWTYFEAYSTVPDAAARLWTIQVAAVLVVVLLAVLGWSPGLQVRITADSLVLRHGRRVATLSVSAISALTDVDILEYHRGYRPYTDVHTYAVRSAPHIIVVKVGAQTYGIGLKGAQQEQLASALREVVEARNAV